MYNYKHHLQSTAKGGTIELQYPFQQNKVLRN